MFSISLSSSDLICVLDFEILIFQQATDILCGWHPTNSLFGKWRWKKQNLWCQCDHWWIMGSDEAYFLGTKIKKKLYKQICERMPASESTKRQTAVIESLKTNPWLPSKTQQWWCFKEEVKWQQSSNSNWSYGSCYTCIVFFSTFSKVGRSPFLPNYTTDLKRWVL